jgi:LuxR family transcriptional regulator, positive regulator of biofilm formation
MVNQLTHRKESRELERFSLRLPTRISALEPGGRTLDLMTENISAGGAFFPTRKLLPEGLTVFVELTLKRESGLGNASKVRLKGTVLPPRPGGMAVLFGKRVQMLPC